MRSNLNRPLAGTGDGEEPAGKAFKAADGSKQQKKVAKEEIPYISVLNRLLPPEIRVLAACEVSPSFNSRFDCLYRVYKYFFVKRDLDIEVHPPISSVLRACSGDDIRCSHIEDERGCELPGRKA